MEEEATRMVPRRDEETYSSAVPNVRLDEALKGVLALQHNMREDTDDLMTVASQLVELCGSLGSCHDDDLTVASCQVPVPFHVSEVVAAKRRHLHSCLTRIQGRVAELTEAVMRLQAESRPETGHAQVHVHHHPEPQPNEDPEFDPDEMRAEMEQAVAQGRAERPMLTPRQRFLDWPFSRRGSSA